MIVRLSNGAEIIAVMADVQVGQDGKVRINIVDCSGAEASIVLKSGGRVEIEDLS